MSPQATSTRPPIPVIILVSAALIVVGLLLAQAASGLFVRIVQLSAILVAFIGIAFVGLFLWRKGDIGRSDSQ